MAHVDQARQASRGMRGHLPPSHTGPQHGPKLPVKPSSFPQGALGSRRQQSGANLGAGWQTGISCSVLIASGVQEQGTLQYISCEVQAGASQSGCSAAEDASQHAGP